MTRMIANAAGDNESQETILDDSPSEASGPAGHAVGDKGGSHDGRPLSHEIAPVDQDRFGHSRVGGEGNLAFHGISRTTDITIQYSTDESRVTSNCDKQQRKDWA